MLKKRLLILLILIVCVQVFLPAQDLRPIGRDLSALLEGIGHDIVPYLQQGVLSGEGIGRASFGEKSHFFIGGSLGTTFTPGMLTFIDEGNTNFELLDVYNLMNTALAGASQQVADLMNTTKTFFIFPTARLSLGVRLPLGIEAIGIFAIIPGALTTGIANLANFTGIELSELNAGLRVRKVLVEDKGGLPAVSVGLGYTYASFHAAYTLAPGTFSQDFSTYTLNVSGKIGLDTRVHTAGMDIAISKKLLIFYPFLKISPWYQWTTYTGSIGDFEAAFVDSSGNTLVDSTTQNISPGSTLKVNDLGLLLSAGVEIAIGKFILMPSGSFNTASKSFHANLNMRLQF